jgi:YHS domain-containing protein
MQVEIANAPASAVYGGHHYSFCSDRCRSRFEQAPERFTAGVRAAPPPDGHSIATGVAE